MQHKSEYFSGQGKVFIAKYNADGTLSNYRFVGNVPALSLEASTEKIEHKESHTGSRSIDKVIVTEQNVAVNFTLEEVTPENLAMAFHADVSEVAGKSVSDETIATWAVGDNWVLAHQNISDLSIADTADQPLVEGQDYIVDKAFGRVTYISKSQTLKAPFKASYTAGKVKKVSFLQQSNPEYALRFEGLNTAENNKPVLVEVHRMAIEPAKTFDLINEELNQFEITGNALMTNGKLVTISTPVTTA